MRSRRAWIVILGPPLVLAAVIGTASSWFGSAIARSPQAGLTVVACDGRPDTPTRAAGTAGTWWSQYPQLDSTGGLAGWIVSVGVPGSTSLRLDLPPSALVSGPDHGRVIASIDDGNGSTLRVFEAATRCQRRLSLDGVVVRRAILVPGRDEAMVHLLDRGSRRDLGVWRMPLDGTGRALVLGPPAAADLRATGIERVWSTDLLLSSDLDTLAVQSCDPETCLTRVLDLRTGLVAVIDGPQGGLIGIDAGRLLTHGRCTGEPCGVVGWDLATLQATPIAADAFGAALTGDGRVVVGISTSDGALDAVEIDLDSGARTWIGRLESGAEPAGGSSSAGVETLPGTVPLTRSDGTPTTLVIDSPPAQETEDRP